MSILLRFAFVAMVLAPTLATSSCGGRLDASPPSPEDAAPSGVQTPDGGAIPSLATLPDQPTQIAVDASGIWVATMNHEDWRVTSLWLVPAAGGTPVHVDDAVGIGASPRSMGFDSGFVYVGALPLTPNGNDVVFRYPTGGGARQVIDVPCVGEHGIDVDGTNLYVACAGSWDFSLSTSPIGSVWALPVDGSAPYPVATALTFPTTVAHDDSYVYFSEDHEGSIRRCPKSGCAGDPELVTHLDPFPSDVRVIGPDVYFATSESNTIGSRINVAPADGGASQTLLDPATNTFDVGAHGIYWTQSDFTQGYVWRSDLDGTNVSLLVSGPRHGAPSSSQFPVTVHDGSVYVGTFDGGTGQVVRIPEP